MPTTRSSTRRTVAVAIASAAPFLILATAYAAGKHQETKPPTAAQKYKNIRVLKALPADRLIPVMHQWNDSLGVQCTFCHEVETNAEGRHVGYERDTKPEKAMARRMVQMVMKLNKSEKLLDGRATCYMCHHGHASPETKVPEAAK